MLRLSIVLAAALVGVTGAVAAPAANDSSEITTPKRTRTQITVYPRSYYPGPNATRHCEAWLQPENRPSGPVITPQMRCWWVRN